MTWDPLQYQRFGDERSRPFFELVGRIQPPEPADATLAVVDLGCGPGALTATLAQRWPNAVVLGVDNDDAMLRSAGAHAGPRTSFEHGDIRDWVHSRRPASLDVIVANASLQWVDGHRDLLPTMLDRLRPGGTLALQVPGNLSDPHHQAIHELRRRQPWSTNSALLDLPLATHRSHTAAEYLDTLASSGLVDVDAWETTYLHVLQGAKPVLEWVRGTALRPILAALDASEPTLVERFCDELAPLLAAAYPAAAWGTLFPFRRVFVVARLR